MASLRISISLFLFLSLSSRDLVSFYRRAADSRETERGGVARTASLASR